MSPVYPLTWSPLIKTGDYPHLAKHDAAVWERFLDQYGGNFLGVAYDVALGGFLPDADLGPMQSRLGWQYSTALKIDVVLLRESEVWICEVKPSANVSALGAALCYTVLAERETLTTLPMLPVVITERASPDIKYGAERLGVTLVELPEPSTPLPGPA